MLPASILIIVSGVVDDDVSNTWHVMVAEATRGRHRGRPSDSFQRISKAEADERSGSSSGWIKSGAVRSRTIMVQSGSVSV